MIYILGFLFILIVICSINSFFDYCDKLKLLEVSNYFLKTATNKYQTLELGNYSVFVYNNNEYIHFNITNKDSNYLIASWRLFKNYKIRIITMKETEFKVFCSSIIKEKI